MKKRLKKFQFGDNNPTTYEDYMLQQFNLDPSIDLSGLKEYIQKRKLGNKPAGSETNFLDPVHKTTFGERAISEGYTLDSDGAYRKLEITENKNRPTYSNFFNGLNAGLDLINLAGNAINDIKLNKEERQKYIDAIQPDAEYNPYETGINKGSIYFKTGGMTSAKAKKILKDGKVHGKTLTDKQKRYFGYIAGGGKPKQYGGVNTTGYLKGSDTVNNDFNIIPSGNITTDGMAFPIIANGELLMPDTGDYKFNTNYVVEEPAMQFGGVPEVKSTSKNKANAMLEQGEVFKTYNGEIKKVAETEDRHEAKSGGSPQANVDYVLEDTADKREDDDSKALLISPKEAEEITGYKPKRSMSHSKLFEFVVKKDEQKQKSFEKKINANIDYINLNGGMYAENSLDENLKLLQDFPTKEQRFKEIYQHQEAVKEINDIDNDSEMCKGGKMKVYQTGSTKKYPDTWTDYYDKQKSVQYSAPTWITPTQFYSVPGLVDYMKTLNDLKGVDNDLNIADDSTWGYRHQAALDKFFPNGRNSLDQYFKPSTPSLVQLPVQEQVNRPANTGVGVTDNTMKYTLPNEIKPSTYEADLGWSGGVGNLLGLINSFGRETVNLEQLNRDYYQVHDQDVTPIINSNLADFNNAVEQLPVNGVGFANQANLLAQKYKADNAAIKAVDESNKMRKTARDAEVEKLKFQLDTTNAGLRDQFTNRVLLAKEKQRQQKFEYLNSLFKAIDDKNAFSNNANLALQLTPYFNEKGEFNNNKYVINSTRNIPGGGTTSEVTDRLTGKKSTIIVDKNGNVKTIEQNINQQRSKPANS